MIRLTRRHILLSGAGALALAGCSPTGTLVARGEGDPLEGGIGGTGIVGTLTDFGSVRVNGLRIELTGQTRIEGAFGRLTAGDLAIGQQLTVEARATAQRLTARRIALAYPLIGTAQAPRRRDATYSVNGVDVYLEPGAIGRPPRGVRVAVSGVWTARGVSASRSDLVPSGADLLAGTLSRDPDGRLRLGTAALDGTTLPAPLGSYVTLLGRHHGGAFNADAVQAGRFTGAAGDLAQLSVEGFLEPSTEAPGERIAGLGHSFEKETRLNALIGQRAAYYGPYTGAFAARRALILPQNLEARRSLLRRVQSGTGALPFKPTR